MPVDVVEAARSRAEDLGFDSSKMLVCQECGRTIIRTQKAGNPGWKDKVFCTCDERGLPMVPVEDNVDE